MYNLQSQCFIFGIKKRKDPVIKSKIHTFPLIYYQSGLSPSSDKNK